MDKRYQVFVSSTYEDLIEERRIVMQELLPLKCIPTGMELFPAASEDQWTIIKRVIDECDYYIAIVAGKLGSIGPKGQSYTEMEYRYADRKGIPVIAFLFEDIGSLKGNQIEEDPDRKKQLHDLRDFMKRKLCKFWKSPEDLGLRVTQSLVTEMNMHPGVGWVKGDTLASSEATAELLKAKNRIEELEKELDMESLDTSDLAQGDDKITIPFWVSLGSQTSTSKKGSQWFNTELTWDSIFGMTLPEMMVGANDAQITKALQRLIDFNSHNRIRAKYPANTFTSEDINIDIDYFNTVIIQLRALGLIEMNKEGKAREALWTLTQKGEAELITLRAVRRFKETEISEEDLKERHAMKAMPNKVTVVDPKMEKKGTSAPTNAEVPKTKRKRKR